MDYGSFSGHIVREGAVISRLINFFRETVAMTVAIGFVASATGCATTQLLEDSKKHTREVFWTVTYDNAFVADGMLTLNGRASSIPAEPGERSISAQYAIDPASGLPGGETKNVAFKHRRKPRNAQRVPIERVLMTLREFLHSPTTNLLVLTDGTITNQVIIVGLSENEFARARQVLDHQNFIFVDSRTSATPSSVVLGSPSFVEITPRRAELIFLPVTIAADIVTLPIQAAVIGLVIWSYHSAYNGGGH